MQCKTKKIANGLCVNAQRDLYHLSQSESHIGLTAKKSLRFQVSFKICDSVMYMQLLKEMFIPYMYGAWISQMVLFVLFL